ncbi:MAG: DUF4270 domain-containing protein [Bacteroides sp.]|nr:DUF4270 domain-containing protein [Bacteroides sp.]
MKIKYLYALLAAILFYSCDDSTTGIGDSTISTGDKINSGVATYNVNTSTILADSVYARTNTAYLGKYTDPQYGEFSADFIAQFNCTDNFTFPETLQEITGIQLKLYYTSFFGDSLNAMRLQVDTLNKVIPETELKTFYTSVNPLQYYDINTKPLAKKAFAARGASVNDTTYIYTDMYGDETSRLTNYWQEIKLPLSLGQLMYNKYVENPDNYKDAESFIKNVLKGIYVHCTHGDGTILYIDDIFLNLNFKYLIESSSGKVDSLTNGSIVFAATKEVIQANRFQNSDRLKELTEDTKCTYLKTPAGLFTEVTLPIEEISEIHQRDTLNAAAITFTRYNEKNDSPYSMGVPKYLLMVRKCDMYSFFENNETYDNKTSFLAEYVSSGESGNTYSFTNIAPLISYCMAEKESGKYTDDWNKVVLIPVDTELDSSNNIIGIKNSLKMQSTSMVGGKNTPIKMQVLYTTF